MANITDNDIVMPYSWATAPGRTWVPSPTNPRRGWFYTAADKRLGLTVSEDGSLKNGVCVSRKGYSIE